MRKILISLLVLVLGVTYAVSGLAAKGGPLPPQPSDEAKNKVSWHIFPFVMLRVSAPSYTFPELTPGIDEYTAENAITLFVISNTKWTLSYEIEGEDSVVSHLSVELGKTEGSWNAQVPVTYKLSDLREMEPGTYQVTVVYTASAE
jgi:hypothetical protein